MEKKIVFALCLVVCCLLLGACDFDSPLTAAPSGAVDERLLGSWKTPSGNSVVISKADSTHYAISYDGKPFTAYQSDISGTRFITFKADNKYFFLQYSLENGNRQIRAKTIGHNLLNASTDAATIRKVVEGSLNNPNLYNPTDLIFVKTDAMAATAAPVIEKPVAAASNEMKSGRFLSNDAEIYYEIHGAKTGVPLFVVHGGPGFDHNYFLSNSAFTELGKTRPIIFYDQRGTGKSAKLSDENAATLQNNVEDLENLRRHLGYEKIDVAGHSFGGLIAMSFAVFFPDATSHLILIDSVPADYDKDYSTFETKYPKEFAEMQAKRFEAIMQSDPKAMRASIVAYMKMLFYSPQMRDAFIAGSEGYSYDYKVNSSVNQSAEGFNITPGIVKLTVPTLILHGRHDANITVDSSEIIQKNIPKSRLVIFEQSGHMPFYEEKEKFIITVNDFLK